jgi:hypothetical protein
MLCTVGPTDRPPWSQTLQRTSQSTRVICAIVTHIQHTAAATAGAVGAVQPLLQRRCPCIHHKSPHAMAVTIACDYPGGQDAWLTRVVHVECMHADMLAAGTPPSQSMYTGGWVTQQCQPSGTFPGGISTRPTQHGMQHHLPASPQHHSLSLVNSQAHNGAYSWKLTEGHVAKLQSNITCTVRQHGLGCYV